MHRYNTGDWVKNRGKKVQVVDILEIDNVDYYLFSDGKKIHCKYFDNYSQL